jgi:hypothetical protein
MAEPAGLSISILCMALLLSASSRPAQALLSKIFVAWRMTQMDIELSLSEDGIV